MKNTILLRLRNLLELVEHYPELFHDSIDEDIKDSLNDIISLVIKL